MLRFHDADRRLELGVHDLIDAGPGRHGGLQAEVARRRAGQQVHTAWQTEREQEDVDFEREVTIRHTLIVRGWEVTISGRVDGLSLEAGRRVVEEVKSTTLPASRLETLESGAEEEVGEQQVERLDHQPLSLALGGERIAELGETVSRSCVTFGDSNGAPRAGRVCIGDGWTCSGCAA